MPIRSWNFRLRVLKQSKSGNGDVQLDAGRTSVLIALDGLIEDGQPKSC